MLELSDNAVKRRGGRALGKALAQCPKLRTLLLETTLLRDQGGVALIEGLAGTHVIVVIVVTVVIVVSLHSPGSQRLQQAHCAGLWLQ